MPKYNFSPAASITAVSTTAVSTTNTTTTTATASQPSAAEYDLLIASPQSLLSTQSDIQHTSNCLKAMAHPLRLKILCLLSKLEHISVLDLVEAVGTSQSNISQHLSILKEKGLLSCEKEANKVYYKLADQDLGDLINSIRKAFCNKNLSHH